LGGCQKKPKQKKEIAPQTKTRGGEAKNFRKRIGGKRKLRGDSTLPGTPKTTRDSTRRGERGGSREGKN